MTITLALLGLALWMGVLLAAHAAVIRAGCAQLDERIPSFGRALAAGLAASLGAFVLTLPLSLTVGCAVGLVSQPLAVGLQTALGIVASGWLLSKLLGLPLHKALSIQTVWSLGLGAMTLLIWGTLQLGQALFF